MAYALSCSEKLVFSTITFDRHDESEYLAIGFLFVMFWISDVIAIGSILVSCNKLAILGEEEDACAALLV